MTSPPRTLRGRTPELFILTLLAAATRFWHLFTPRAVVFDEIWSETFAGHYLARSYFLDVHPPLAKLLFAAMARVAGLGPEQLIHPQPAVLVRILPAVAGTLLVPLVYRILRQLDGSRRVATLGAAFVLLDNALLVESRLILPESILIFFGLAALLAYLQARRSAGHCRLIGLSIAALLAGCAVSVKWTGASALGVILASWLVEALAARMPLRRFTGEALLLIVTPVAVYVAAFALHFALLTRTGGTYDVAMSPLYQATLVGNAHYDPRVHLSFITKFVELHRAMMSQNTGFIGVTHTGSSQWYTWPIMKHPFAYWIGDVSAPESGVVLLLGNPLVWWTSLIASIGGVLLFVWQRARWAGREFALAFLTGAYVLNFAPFAAIRRLMFLYHYLFALTIVAMLGALSLGVMVGWAGDDEIRFGFESRRSAASYWLLLMALAASFLYFAPLSYALPISKSSFDFHFWLLHPRF